MSKNEIKKLFPTPLYIGNIGVNEDWLTYINSLDFELTYLKNGLQTQDRHILLHKDLSSLKKKIDNEFEIYATDKLRINKKHNFEMINSWCNIHNQGHVAQPHHHQNSMFSGVYYLQSTENTGAIKFNQSPFKSWNNIMIKLEIDEANEFNNDECIVNPMPGTVVLFPSCVSHETDVNNTTHQRYSLAFNYFPRGQFGEKESYLEIK